MPNSLHSNHSSSSTKIASRTYFQSIGYVEQRITISDKYGTERTLYGWVPKGISQTEAIKRVIEQNGGMCEIKRGGYDPINRIDLSNFTYITKIAFDDGFTVADWLQIRNQYNEFAIGQIGNTTFWENGDTLRAHGNNQIRITEDYGFTKELPDTSDLIGRKKRGTCGGCGGPITNEALSALDLASKYAQKRDTYNFDPNTGAIRLVRNSQTSENETGFRHILNDFFNQVKTYFNDTPSSVNLSASSYMIQLSTNSQFTYLGAGDFDSSSAFAITPHASTVHKKLASTYYATINGNDTSSTTYNGENTLASNIALTQNTTYNEKSVISPVSDNSFIFSSFVSKCSCCTINLTLDYLSTKTKISQGLNTVAVLASIRKEVVNSPKNALSQISLVPLPRIDSFILSKPNDRVCRVKPVLVISSQKRTANDNSTTSKSASKEIPKIKTKQIEKPTTKPKQVTKETAVQIVKPKLISVDKLNKSKVLAGRNKQIPRKVLPSIAYLKPNSKLVKSNLNSNKVKLENENIQNIKTKAKPRASAVKQKIPSINLQESIRATRKSTQAKVSKINIAPKKELDTDMFAPVLAKQIASMNKSYLIKWIANERSKRNKTSSRRKAA
ncbi:MAG: hypothetical protein AABX38_03640 [Candidatus Micrarchaeota archaeon]